MYDLAKVELGVIFNVGNSLECNNTHRHCCPEMAGVGLGSSSDSGRRNHDSGHGRNWYNLYEF